MGTALSSVFVGLVLYGLSQAHASYAMSLPECLAFGSLVSATDPVNHPHTRIYHTDENATSSSRTSGRLTLSPPPPTHTPAYRCRSWPSSNNLKWTPWCVPSVRAYPTKLSPCTLTESQPTAFLFLLQMFYLVFGESVLNDAVALVLFNIFSKVKKKVMHAREACVHVLPMFFTHAPSFLTP